MPTRTIKIFEHKEVKLPWNWSKKGIDLTRAITWDEKKTTVTSARLRLTVDPSSGHVKSWIEHNYNEVGRIGWALGDASSKSEEFDSIGNLVNGSNYFKVVVAKELGNIGPVTFIVSAVLVITYEGEDVDDDPDWKKYLTYAGAGLGTVAALVTIRRGLREEVKERKR